MQEIGSRVVNAVKTFVRTAISPLKAIKGSAGLGIGLGAKGSVNVQGLNIEAGVSNSITDSLEYDKGTFDIKNTTSTKIGATIADVLDFSYSSGKAHSFLDSQCSCNILHTPFVEQANCSANTKFKVTESVIGLSAGVYLGLGTEVSIGIDIKAWVDELIDIFNDSINYY